GVDTEKSVTPANFSAGIDFLRAGYRYLDTVYFASSGTFSKADYPEARAIRVKLVGGGGAGGGSVSGANYSVGQGGGAGGCAEAFITDLAALDASVAVTIGAGGVGQTAGPGTAGGATSFGTHVAATGGDGGLYKISNVYSPYVSCAP